ncbi:MAG: electron transfer flavoprotein subunit beta/FixA family protein [Desulfarculaceae bacterium]|nr:electron transfer flavoprotein subunit beta/FixA family protein [Desulfarculaceae bacterium]
MRVLCLLKQVCEPESLFDLQEGRPVLRPPARWKMSSYDEYALEAALALKDARPDTEVTALSLGPARCEAVLERALGMGADRAVRLDDLDETIARPLAVASAVAAWAEGQGFDLILAGVMSDDAMQGAVGPMLAELLGLPLATGAVELALAEDAKSLTAQREMEGGRRQEVTLPLPALATINSGPARPRYPTLSKLLKAKETAPLVIDPTAPAPPLEAVREYRLPVKTRAGLMLSGDIQAKASRLLDLLRERALL